MRKVKILIVDDYPENILALSELIAADDVEIFSAPNATEALELVSKNEFGLALLDVQMPEIGGFELATIIRSVARFTSLPIIFVTAHQQENSFAFNGYKTGAVDLLFKPLDPYMVRAKVRVFVEMAQQKTLLQDQVKELERLRRDADAANLAKSQFLANMSHEIRTPLSAVMGFADLLTRDQVTEKEREECAAAVKRNGDLLMRLIDDILDLSKIEANKLELDEEEFSLSELLREIDSTMSFRAHEKGVELNFAPFSFKQDSFVSDTVRIKQVLLNIIGNAIKFTKSGGKVTVEPSVSEIGSRYKLEVKVKDNGIGLTEEQAKNLFQPFSQADTSTKRKFGGSGLGLTISREIAIATGGDIRILSSAPGVGTTFQIEIYFDANQVTNSKSTRPQNLPGQAEGSAYLKGLKILAVDDSPDNLTLISMYLKNSGADVTYAESAISAIAEAEKKAFDIILMDIQMPGMDGHEATEKIRKQGFKNPIVALTAHVLREEHEKCRASGCNDVLTKPISRATLTAKLAFLKDQYFGAASAKETTI